MTSRKLRRRMCSRRHRRKKALGALAATDRRSCSLRSAGCDCRALVRCALENAQRHIRGSPHRRTGGPTSPASLRSAGHRPPRIEVAEATTQARARLALSIHQGRQLSVCRSSTEFGRQSDTNGGVSYCQPDSRRVGMKGAGPEDEARIPKHRRERAPRGTEERRVVRTSRPARGLSNLPWLSRVETVPSQTTADVPQRSVHND